jgi:high-affinity nickel-transport protein
VFVTTIIIAVSVAAANHLDGFGEKGGIVGASISGSTLLLLAAINSVLLWKTWRRLQAARKAQAEAELSTEKGIDDGPLSPGVEKTDEAQLRDTEQQTPPRKLHFEGCLTRAVAPLLRALDRPWKLFPIGLLFGLGFDTASTIALLSVALAASQTGGDAGASSAKVVLLALLFTAGMSLVDTCDNILMLFCYAPERPVGPARWRIFEVRAAPEPQPALPDDELVPELPASVAPRFDAPASTLSLGLTALSICLAASIGLIVLLGLIGDECARCVRAADKQDETGDGGLEGRWWLAWRRANDQSGYIGAAIVGVFALSLAVFYASRWLRSRYARPATPAPQQPVL